MMYTEGETCADRGYFPIRDRTECLYAIREISNWSGTMLASTTFDEEGLPGCWTAPGVREVNLLHLADFAQSDLTKKLVCKHVLDEAAPPQVKSRLFDGTTGEPSQDNKGLLQVWDGYWHSFCDDGKTSEQDLTEVANMACLEMGFSSAASIRGDQMLPNKILFDPSTHHTGVLLNGIVIGRFDCLGSETSLFQCPYGKGTSNTDCSIASMIEVTCTSEAPREPTSLPTFAPTLNPTAAPTVNPTANPTAEPTANATPKPIVDTGNCAWEKHWFWGGDHDDFCSCPGGFVKIGRWGIYSEWQKIEGAGVRCKANQFGDPLWGVIKECRCGQRSGKVGNNRRSLKIHPLA